MTHLRRGETNKGPVEGATSTAIEAPAPSRILFSPLGSIERCFAFFGYAIVCLVLVAAILEFMSWAIWSVQIWSVHPSVEQTTWLNQQKSPVYEGADWAKELWKEEFLRNQIPKVYVPFRLWSVTNWHGKYVNNDASPRGVWRRTLNPSNCDPRRTLEVWTFGGSTMYGYAVPDWATIPSYLSRELNASPQNCVVVSNFGVEGYVNDQELIALEELLKTGAHPDIVVFYDGVNDSALAWNPSGPPPAHFVFETIKSRVGGSVSGRLDFLKSSYTMGLVREILSKIRPRRSFAALTSRSQPNVALVLDNYEANLRIARALSNAYQFKLYCFWQPILFYGHKPLVPFEQHIVQVDTNGTSMAAAWLPVMREVYQQAERRAAVDSNFIFLGNLFDSTKDPIYIDEFHLGPEGNELAAKAIANYVRTIPGNR